MPLTHLIILALIQGITEFLPISSSGHLVLAHHYLGVTAHDVMMDVAVHLGTLLAVFIYFYKDVLTILTGAFDFLRARKTDKRRLFLCFVIGSLPVIAAGLVIHMFWPTVFRSLEIMAWATIGFAILLWIADRKSPQMRETKDITYKDALWIGIGQILALIPGTSRSGITMTLGRFVGLTRESAARFSLLLAIAAISGAGVLNGIDLYHSRNLALSYDLLMAAGMAFLSALIAIAAMMAWLRKASFTPFIIYRLILGAGLLILIYGGYLS